MWLTPERRRVIHRYTPWNGGFHDERAYERRLAWLNKNSALIVVDETIEDQEEEETDHYELDDVRKDMLILYNKIEMLKRNTLPIWIKVVAILAIVSAAIWIGWKQ
jgi:hypothetical protein